MITETLIEITNQISILTKLHDDNWNNLNIGFIIGFIGMISGFIFFGNDKSKIFSPSLFIVAGLGIILLAISLGNISGINIQLDDLKEQRKDLIKSDIETMTCDNIRLDILFIMTNKTIPDYIQDQFEFEKDYYYHKCEIPLRDEVLKLQKEN